MSEMLPEPVEPTEAVAFVAPAEPSEADLDAVDLMWMERLAQPHTPTPYEPFRAVRCTATTRGGPRAGRQCGRMATLGTTICEAHGANLPAVQKAAAARVQMARLKLINAVPDSVDVMIELRDNSPSDAVRGKMATEILDRAGVRGGTEIDVKVEAVDPADVLRQRLQSLALKSGADVIDAEVVYEDDTVEGEQPEQLALDWE